MLKSFSRRLGVDDVFRPDASWERGTRGPRLARRGLNDGQTALYRRQKTPVTIWIFPRMVIFSINGGAVETSPAKLHVLFTASFHMEITEVYYSTIAS